MSAGQDEVLSSQVRIQFDEDLSTFEYLSHTGMVDPLTETSSLIFFPRSSIHVRGAIVLLDEKYSLVAISISQARFTF